MNSVAILGASGTIGSAVARRLTAAEEKVFLLGRNTEKLEPLARELNQRSHARPDGEPRCADQPLY